MPKPNRHLSRMSKQLNMEVLSRITPNNQSCSSLDSETHGEASGKAALALFSGEHRTNKLGPPPPIECVLSLHTGVCLCVRVHIACRVAADTVRHIVG